MKQIFIDHLMSWWQFLQDGGPVMYPIFLCSVTAVAIIFERFWMLRRRNVMVDSVIRESASLLRDGKVAESRATLEASNTSLARIILAGMDKVGHTRAEIKAAMENAGSKENFQLNQFVNMLGNIATLTPLLGFLGTVYGMIMVFKVIAVTGVGEASSVAGGIGVALITTASGLTIGIPAFIFYRYFLARVENFMVQMEERSNEFLDLIDALPSQKEGAS